jgi:hypothetical protein
VICIYALVAKVRRSRNRHEGSKHVLGIWVASAEGCGKAWAQALAQLRNRSREEVLFVCCEGQAGLGKQRRRDQPSRRRTEDHPRPAQQTCPVKRLALREMMV